MSQSAAGRRGSYAKGVAKREEILARALEVIARGGYGRASVKELADAAGLSQAGLLHYFESKSELFTEILRKRDEIDAERLGPLDEDADLDRLREGYVGIVRHNSEVPGLVELFSRTAVEAADPGHPAHRYFLERGERVREAALPAIARAQAEGRVTAEIDPESLVRIVQAVADGLQLQFLLDPAVDMAAIVDALFGALTAPDRADGS
ncbi:MAG: TetR/AcrR family transcriptional regulator [Chloroflexota bacterium]|nr:TetR/AcrR family transcriptional regulator [Chloroflexota bacterium]